MRLIMVIVLSAGLAIAAGAADKAPAAKVRQASVAGVKYGKGAAAGETVKISELHAKMDKYEGKRVRVEGPVVAVCPKRGCWLRLGSDKPYQDLLFKVKDGEMVFPMGAQGKYAVAEGILRKVTLTLEQTIAYLKEQAEERGESFDEKAVKEPLTFPKLEGLGAVIREKK